MDNRVIAGKIVRNTFYNVLGNIWNICVSLFLVPYIVRGVGQEKFGVLALAGVLSGSMGLLDFGISTAYVRYIAEFYARKEFDKISRLINTGFLVYLALSIVLLCVFFGFSDAILGFLKIPQHLFAETKWIFALTIVLFGISNSLGAFAAVQAGLQRMDITNKVAILLSIPNILGTVFVIKSGYGIIGVMLNNCVFCAINISINLVVAYRLVPAIRFRMTGFDIGFLKTLFSFGYKMQLSKIGYFISIEFDKLLIVYFLSIGLITFYQLGMNLVNYLIVLFMLFISVFIPAFTEIEVSGGRELLIAAYLRTTKFVAMLVAPVFMLLIFLAVPVVNVWLGAGYEKTAVVAQILAFGFLLNTISHVPESLAIAVNKPKLLAKSALVGVSMNVVLSLLFVKLFGFYGVAVGTAIASNVATMYFLVIVHKEINVKFSEFWKVTLPFIFISFFVSLAVFLVNRAVMPEAGPDTIGVLAVEIIIFFLAYAALAVWTKSLSASDMDFLACHVPVIRKVKGFFRLRGRNET